MSSMDFRATHRNYTSPFSHKNDTLIVIQNPSAQNREEYIEIQLPYYNYTLHEIVNGT